MEIVKKPGVVLDNVEDYFVKVPLRIGPRIRKKRKTWRRIRYIDFVFFQISDYDEEVYIGLIKRDESRDIRKLEKAYYKIIEKFMVAPKRMIIYRSKKGVTKEIISQKYKDLLRVN